MLCGELSFSDRRDSLAASAVTALLERCGQHYEPKEIMLGSSLGEVT